MSCEAEIFVCYDLFFEHILDLEMDDKIRSTPGGLYQLK